MIFVVGSSRSGTTMMGRVLGKCPLVHTFGELHFFEHMVDSAGVRDREALPKDQAEMLVRRLLTSSRKDFFTPVEAGAYSHDVAAILAKASAQDAVTLYRTALQYETEAAGATIACEQTPRYLFFLDEILATFPEARVVFMVRDPRAVLVSQANKWRRRFLGAKNIPLREAVRAWSNYHPFIIAKLWASCSAMGRRFAADPRVMTVRFEDLLSDPEAVVASVAAHTGIPYTQDMLAVPQIGSSHGQDTPDQLGVNPAMISSWKSGGLSLSALGLCEWVAGDQMRHRGYELQGSGSFPWRTISSMVMLIFKMAIALPLNLSRTKNLRETLRRRFGKGSL